MTGLLLLLRCACLLLLLVQAWWTDQLASWQVDAALAIDRAEELKVSLRGKLI